MNNFGLYLIVSLCLKSFIHCAVVKDNFRRFPPATEEKLLQQDRDYWWQYGTEQLQRVLEENERQRRNVAKNVIIFIGDGMGISTITAARIYKGQREYGKMGEEHCLNFENFPNVGLVKTYTVDKQVPDSAATATSIFSGIKTRYKMLGLDQTNYGDIFNPITYEEGKLEGIMKWAQDAGKDTGIVTTTRITHATPAATYANINHRDWECDSKVPPEYRSQVKDIPRQLVEDAPGKNFRVILGGGLQMMGYVYDAQLNECQRTDNLNLTKMWEDAHSTSNAKFVTDNQGLASVDENTEYLLGLFHANHLPFELQRDAGPTGTPSLTDLTAKALQLLRNSQNGYVLLIEGGLIDIAHHKNTARMALSEAAEFDRAIEYALNETNPDETLILVTADHSHGFTISGYPKRGNDILGLGNETAKENTYYTAAYVNGPGFNYHFVPNKSHPWIDVSDDENLYSNPFYVHRGAAYLKDETHGGEDVAVFATGPGSQLIRGVFEQNYLAHVVSHAACIGPHATLNEYCNDITESYYKSNGVPRTMSFHVLCISVVVKFMILFNNF
ncbi:alkaline phosphatase 4-like [Agrilus planipennis]|uniref:Alkaline phosphatase n=1 Tax=Agrilus planipennis TaxID=224129 RepID=A0A1W4XGQ6_AGRPL|nr:alkaline phosphatase 4-like [Agrilus planipennis]